MDDKLPDVVWLSGQGNRLRDGQVDMGMCAYYRSDKAILKTDLEKTQLILKECAEFVHNYCIVIHPVSEGTDAEKRIIRYLNEAINLLEGK